MALGKFKVPESSRCVGQEGAELTTLPNTNPMYQSPRLHPDFAAAVKSWCENNPGHPDFTNHGYLTYAEMEKYARDGFEWYIQDSCRRLFGWGLALELVGSEWTKENQYAIDNLAYFGMRIEYDMNGLGQHFGFAYICPNDVEIGHGEEGGKVFYEGDIQVDWDGQPLGTGNALFYSSLFDSFKSTSESELNRGIRAFANDVPVWNSVQELLHASMRYVQTMPDGSIAAFYPDRWGISEYGGPHVIIPQIEVESISVNYKGDSFVSHVYSKPVTLGGDQMSVRYSIGAVGIESDANALGREATYNSSGATVYSKMPAKIFEGFIPKSILYGEKSYEFSPDYLYKRYGVQKKEVSANQGAKLIQLGFQAGEQNPQYILPFLVCLYEFMKAWAEFQKFTVQIAFNPYIWPGCRVKIQGMGLTFFVESVSHNMSYSGGFSTTITASSPCGSLVGTIER